MRNQEASLVKRNRSDAELARLRRRKQPTTELDRAKENEPSSASKGLLSGSRERAARTKEQGAIGILPTGKPSFVPMSNMADFQMPALWISKQLAIALTGKADAE